MVPIPRLTAGGAAVLVAAALAGIVATDRALPPDLGLLRTGGDWVYVVAAVTSTAVGTALTAGRPRHPVGWCFLGLGLSIGGSGALSSYGLWGTLFHPGSLPAAAEVAAVCNVLFIVWLVLIGLVCYLTPTGQQLSPGFGWAARAMVAAAAVWLGLSVISTEPMDMPFEAVPNPWAVATSLGPVGSVAAVVTNALLLVGAASLVVRFRRARGDERRRLLWMAVAVLPLPAVVVLAFVASRTGDDQLLNAAAGIEVAVLPVGAALSITRYHLYDVERILSRAVSYLLVSAVLGTLYAAVVVFVARGVGQAAGRSQIGIALATLGVATAARPAYRAIQDAVDRRFDRRRYDAVHRVRRHVAAPDPAVTVEQVLRDAVGDPTLAVAYRVEQRDQWVTGDGHPTVPADDALAVERGGRPVARVSYDPAQDELVRLVVAEAGPELDNAGLRAAVALQLETVRASRTRIATAQVEERRRIERALHDGAQQRLLALAAQQQAALLNGDPERLREALRTGVAESRTAVAELRELARGLHPSVLTDGGLTAALDDLASRLPVRVHVAEPGRRFPAPVEGTAWFVACEAVTNAVKHAGAGRIDVTLGADDSALRLTVADDGCGTADPDGTGLRGLADRVAAVQGRLTVRSGPGAGTVVEAELPCAS